MWLAAASMHMEGNEAKWLQSLLARFIKAVETKFGVYDYRKAMAELLELELKQKTTVKDYFQAFEDSH
jgi:hypothetical protein